MNESETDRQRTEVLQGFETAFVNEQTESDPAYRPELISNDPAAGRQVLPALEEELEHCDGFLISVAFITSGGLEPLLMTLKELEDKGIPGRILTTDYLYFSQPQALRKFQSLTNVELRIYCTGLHPEQAGFHTKGYLFRRGRLYRMIIGSSNLTASALKTSREWNTRFIGYQDGQTVRSVLAEFDELWTAKQTKRFEEYIDTYEAGYQKMRLYRSRLQKLEPKTEEKLKPNAMQQEVVKNVLQLYHSGQDRGLLISATGTGKTYASAFAMQALKPRKLLFLVHRKLIAEQALKSYQRIFGMKKEDGSTYDYQLLSGEGKRDLECCGEADFVFATMQTMVKEEVRTAFARDHFDAIVIDEAHHAGAASYQTIMDWFRPKFWLGMTATPDTQSHDIYQTFHHNIVYEIRLQQAMEENYLCPFHYFGLPEYVQELPGDQGSRDLAVLTSDERVDYILKNAFYYGSSGTRVKGIVFCSRLKEAEILSQKFNARHLRTAVLSGSVPEEERQLALEKLSRDIPDDMSREQCEYLDYIFAVDVLSEGVDVPEINQVLLLRPTQSAVVFVQQLGRGLRKAENKEFVVVLDFIGNYQSNFLIPIALSGDRSYNKDNLRRYVQEGSTIVPGFSTIHFAPVSQQKIYEAIDKANFNELQLIRENYQELKFKLGRIPSLQDFETYGSIDVLHIFANHSLGSYHTFLRKYEPEYRVSLSAHQELELIYVSRKFASGKRLEELELLSILLQQPETADLRSALQQELIRHGITIDEPMWHTVTNLLTGQFARGTGRKTYASCRFLQEEDGRWQIDPAFAEDLQNKAFHAQMQEVVRFGLNRWHRVYQKRYRDTDLVLYQKYTYEDVCRLLNWETQVVPQNIGGYLYNARTKTLPVFINYDKPADIQDTIRYEDRFLDSRTLIAISKSNRTEDSEDVQQFLHAEERGIAVHLFVRKNKKDAGYRGFYYLGTMRSAGKPEEITLTNTQVPAVELFWKLDTPVPENLYRYLTE